MQVKEIIITNFRGIYGTKTITFGQFNTLVGRNDAGKSTIMKALDHFLNDTQFSPESLNVRALADKDKKVTIELVLDAKNTTIIIDESVETTFESEELTNADGFLQVKKVWDCSKSRITPEIFIMRKIYSEHDFISLSEAKLIKLCNDLNIETKKANGQDYNNVEKRAKLRDYLKKQEVKYSFGYEKLPTSGDNRFREVLKELKAKLPRFEYFKADTSLSETDASIQKFFRDVALSTIRNEVSVATVESKICSKLESILNKITDKINKIVPEKEKITADIKFDWAKLVTANFRSKHDDGDIPFYLRGDGFRRITMMAYFEYLAEQDKNEKQNILFGFEEPETFLHPSAQELLFEKLVGMCENGYQVVISTHSPIIVANSKLSDLIHIKKENNEYVIQQNITNVKEIVEDLGINVGNQFVSLFDKAKCLLLVEGVDDAVALNHVSELYKAQGECEYTLEELGVVTIPVGGCGSIKHWVALNLSQSLNKPFFVFLDSDRISPNGQSPNREALINYGLLEGIDFAVTKKRELENYIPPSALNRLVPGANINYGSWDDVKATCKQHALAKQLGGSKVVEKHFRKLTFEEVKSTFCDDSSDEFLELVNKIRNKLF